MHKVVEVMQNGVGKFLKGLSFWDVIRIVIAMQILNSISKSFNPLICSEFYAEKTISLARVRLGSPAERLKALSILYRVMSPRVSWLS